MSGIALIWAANVKGLKPAAKIVLIQLADFHNKETGQCNPSAQRLADECEMNRATVFRHLTTLEAVGLMTRHSRGDGAGGRGSNHYELHLDVTLGPSAQPGEKSQIATGGKVAKNEGGSRSAATGVVAICDTNLTKEPGKEPVCAASAAEHTHPGFEGFWQVYPRPKGLAATKRAFARAVANGADPAAIVAGAEAYADENAGNGRQYLAFSQNWLNEERWLDHGPETKPIAKVGDLAKVYADRIMMGKRIFGGPVSNEVRDTLIKVHGLTPEEIDRAEVAV